MSIIRDIYARGHTIGGALIRHWDAEAPHLWSHCGAIVDTMGAPFVVEARAFHGVRVAELRAFIDRYSVVEIVEYEVPDQISGNRWLLDQVGCGYDYLAVFGRLCRRSWDEPTSWHCRELCEGRLAAAGRRRFRASPALITPNLGYMTL